MNRKAYVQNVINILNDIDYDNAQVAIRQLASSMDLIETVIIDIDKEFEREEKICEHPKDELECLNVMGDGKTHLEYKCNICNEIIIKE